MPSRVCVTSVHKKCIVARCAYQRARFVFVLACDADEHDEMSGLYV